MSGRMKRLSRILGRWGWWGHTTDDNRDCKNPERRAGWMHRRAWLHQGEDARRSLRAEWVIFPRMSDDLGLRLGFSVEAGSKGSEDDLAVSLQLGFLSLYLGCEGFLPRLDGYDDRRVAVQWYGRSLSWDFWTPADSWDSRTPKWRSGSFDPVRFVFGDYRHTREAVETLPAEVPMPEGAYPAVVTIERCTWERPRWPWWPSRIERLSANIEVEGGVPVPGKGENSWDCGEDAIYSLGSCDPTPEGAVAAMVKSALRDRRRYGGSNWRPKERASA